MQQPFRFMSFREWVPDGARFWIYILFLMCFQFSGGIYFAAMESVAGTLSLTPDDVRMLGNTVLVGLTLYFPLAFRLKFRFTNRTCLMVAAVVLTAVNLVVPHVRSMPVLTVLCFVAGFFRLWGTFECFSSILPRVAPTHNYAVFLSLVFFVVLGFVHVFDIAASYIMYYYSWPYIHYAAAGLLLVVLLGACVLMRPFRPMPRMPLYGVDWLGMALWATFVLAAIFVAQYGQQLEWFHSPRIRAAAGISCLALAANMLRMRHIRHPFIDPEAFRARNIVNLLLLFLFLDVLLASQHVLQNVFTGAVLHLDQLNAVNLYRFDVVGMLLGALFSWFALAKLKWHHKLVCFVGMALVTLYAAMMYTLLTPGMETWRLYLPLICCGIGHVMVFISLTTYAQATVPLRNYFQVLCILGFVRTGIGGPLGEAIYTRALEAQTSLHPSMTVALRELFGWSIVLGVLVLILIAASRFKDRVGMPIPTFMRMYRVTDMHK
ncbi:EmrB/QacA family drug resistance transporter [Bacteroidia bacterium]|nr:EmrB/QacA family drug resistance transporter [Bacteroidia bacterium]